MQLARNILRVRSPEALAPFYQERLGMKLLDEGPPIVLGYGGEDAAIELHPATSGSGYKHRRSDRYWKIGITLPNVDIAQAQLIGAGVEVSAPGQFGTIGYMCHLEDPEGFSIELLQHRFGTQRARDGAQRTQGEEDPAKPLGGGAVVGQITLRTRNIEASLGFYRDRLGMTLLSIQPVVDFGFTLYFLAFTDERPPYADLEAVENREWLWQRPYTTLELQHVSSAPDPFTLPADGARGFAGIAIAGADDRADCHVDECGGAVEFRC